MSDPKSVTTKMTIRKKYVPYINGKIYDVYGGEAHSVRMFSTLEEAKRLGFEDVRQIEVIET